MKLNSLFQGVVLEMILCMTINVSLFANTAMENVKLLFNKDNGDMTVVASNTGDTIFSTGIGEGLWKIQFEDGSSITNRDFVSRDVDVFQLDSCNLIINYCNDVCELSVPIKIGEKGFECYIQINKAIKNIHDISFPLSLDLNMSELSNVIFPIEQGIKLKPSFYAFGKEVGKWHSTRYGGAALKEIAGLKCRIYSNGKETDRLTVNPLYSILLGEELVQEWNKRYVFVGRPAEKSPTYDIIQSSKGSFLSMDKVGEGFFIRYAGRLRKRNEKIAVTTVAKLLTAIQQKKFLSHINLAGKNKIVVLDFQECPSYNKWSEISVDKWSTLLSYECNSFELVRVHTMEEMLTNLNGKDVFAIINPYGENIPKGFLSEQALIYGIKNYIFLGGIWVESGGYPFFSRFEPKKSNILEDYYPFAFCDFFRVNNKESLSYSFYGIQDTNFIPMYWNTFGNILGGHICRKWFKYIEKGKNGRTPSVRFVFGNDIQEDIDNYRRENKIGKPLKEKVSMKILDLWKSSILIKYGGSSLKQQIRDVDKLPSPSLVYVTNFLKGGFDKQYPNFLPPNPKYGTMNDFLKLSARFKERGMLFMPYTNLTWWCDNPKGEWFEKCGSKALSIDDKGHFHKEVYGNCIGWSVSPWHSDVVSIGVKASSEFAEAGAEVLFQDQSGARGAKRLKFDFNPAAPSPDSYVQGFINLSKNIASIRPLATEHGYDHMIAAQSEFCGLAFRTIPFDEMPWLVGNWLVRYQDMFNPEDYEVYPLAQMVAKGDVFFANHLGDAIATYPSGVSWLLSLGYQLFVTVRAGEITENNITYMNMLSDLQKNVSRYYMGTPLSSFKYILGSGHEGVIKTQYGELTIIANFTQFPFLVNEGKKNKKIVIAPGGFYARSPVSMAGYLLEYDGKVFKSPCYIINGKEYSNASEMKH